jgi:predicted ATPase
MNLTQGNIKYFRSLYDINLSFKPLTIIIGPNASGKSNLFKALRFLYDGIAGDRLDWQTYDGQMDELLWYGYDDYGERPNALDFNFGFGEFSDDLPVTQYIANLICGDYLEVSHEKLAVLLNTGDESLTTYFERDRGSIRQNIGQRGNKLKNPARSQAQSSRVLQLREEGPSIRLPNAKAVYSHIAGWRFFDVNLQSARQDAFIPQYPETVPPLAGDANNLSAFLYALYQVRPEDLDAIIETMIDFIELPQSLLVDHDAERGGQTARYRFVEQPFGENRLIPPESMSDGTIRLLAHLALLLADRSVTLACLEEPDNGLHPRLMLYLADIFRQAVEPLDTGGNEVPSSPQIIVTTHSPDFMDCFDLEAEAEYLQVYVAERDEGGRTIYTSTNAQQLKPWLQRYRLGEAVRRRFI